MIERLRKRWHAISRLGLHENEGVEGYREIILLNRLLSISPIVMAIYLPVEVVLNGWKLVPAVSILIILLLIPLLMNRYRMFVVAKFMTLAIIILFIFFAGLMVGKGVHNHVAYIPSVLMSLLLFHSKRVRVISFLIITLIFLYQQYLLNVISPYYEIEPLLKERFSILFFVMALFLTFIIGWYFLSLNSQYEMIIQEQKISLNQKAVEIADKHKEITDSIHYASRIQRSFLATKQMLDENLNDYFVFFQPKDVVSGDFYWSSILKNGNFAFCCADSTGHGVPGAIMSILNISSLEKAIETATEPHLILNKTRELIIERLKKDGSPEGGKDGMDCSLLVLNHDKTELSFASANNPVFIVRSVTSSGSPEAAVSRSETHELLEFRPDKMPVGKHDKDQEPFTLQTISLQKGDVIYTLTDGFPDQFGGEKGKKYMIKNLKNLLLSISHLPMNEQEERLFEEFTRWKGENEQIDDVCIIGVRV
jgi:serine phosphatase RsbU (regulator of sigma subunit)